MSKHTVVTIDSASEPEPESTTCPADSELIAVEQTEQMVFPTMATAPLSGLYISSKIKPNARQCTLEILAKFSMLKQIWTYASFPDHNNGQCTDFMTIGINGYSSKTLGDAIASYCIENAVRMRIDWLVWNRRIWRRVDRGRGKGWDVYTGPKPHTDHVHVQFGLGEYVPMRRVYLPIHEVRPDADPVWDPKVKRHGIYNVKANGTLGKLFRRPGFQFKTGVAIIELWGHQWLKTKKGNLYRMDYLRLKK